MYKKDFHFFKTDSTFSQRSYFTLVAKPVRSAWRLSHIYYIVFSLNVKNFLLFSSCPNISIAVLGLLACKFWIGEYLLSFSLFVLLLGLTFVCLNISLHICFNISEDKISLYFSVCTFLEWSDIDRWSAELHVVPLSLLRSYFTLPPPVLYINFNFIACILCVSDQCNNNLVSSNELKTHMKCSQVQLHVISPFLLAACTLHKFEFHSSCTLIGHISLVTNAIFISSQVMSWRHE